MGDFNIDVINRKNGRFIDFLSLFGVKPELSIHTETMNFKSQINVIFSDALPCVTLDLD